MNKKIITLLSISLLTANLVYADYSYVDSSDFTGDAFFEYPDHSNDEKIEETHKSSSKSMPPLKKMRIKIKNKLYQRSKDKIELAPVAPVEVLNNTKNDASQFASKEINDDFDETMMPDGFEADEEAVQEIGEKKHFWQRKAKKTEEVKDTESIILECDNVDYDSDEYAAVATGNVSVHFVKQGSTLKADKIIYDRVNNTIKAEGNVRILKEGKTVTGEYIFVDLNEENALLEKPCTDTEVFKMKAKKAYLYGDKVVQESGKLEVDKSFPIKFRNMQRGPRNDQMMFPEQEEDLTNKQDSIVKIKAKDIIITEKGDLEVIALKKASFFKGNKKFFKVPAVKLYTNKNLDFFESNIFEIGFLRGLGMYMGPGFVFEIPGGSVLKAMPILNYNSGFGVGAVGRYHSASNWTQVAYGTAESKFLVRGKQELDDHLYLQYAVNDYMSEWFMGRRRPKYGASLVFENGHSTKNFLFKDRPASIKQRIDAGIYHDFDKDNHNRSLHNNAISTPRIRYMLQGSQNLYNYRNEDKQTALSFNLVGQMAATLYGTGDTQTVGRLGPMLHTQYKRWMQDLGYFQSAYDDNSPMPVFDSYRYGNSNVYLRESFRISKYLTFSWFASICLSEEDNSLYGGNAFRENAFYISVGPEDMKFSFGYDVERERTMFVVEVMMDAKGSNIEYEKLEIKQDKKAKERKDVKDETNSNFQKPTSQPILKHAVVEQVKVTEDVL